MMKGRSRYRLPDKRALKQHYNQNMQEAIDKTIFELAKREMDMGGRIQVCAKDTKMKIKNEKLDDEDELKKYVTHFSQIADLVEEIQKQDTKKVVVGLAKGITMKVQENKIKLDLKNALMKNMIKSK